ncbi:MAG: hypothetical protein BGO05_21235 [Rhizobiales bacterium 63-7]|uniref:DUF3168 domain-containing protein n=1 Tax=Rhizobium sp. YJ-22 TaxID=3037556 RepID=UPI00092B27C3|nr:DUF3168 domain-containing protein [Rhizobium sp. YJ-22]MBN9029002.1 DUF3168 domain-containing protein [Hyphomicrobiales bacterium]MDG3574852.1 DUF3168 domain-containing protein [Rhizobium sp. YJ-22]OJU71827.1 MAG: hypothetical protein BGO05_21235 [Rhizobiales bacterium 63-7]
MSASNALLRAIHARLSGDAVLTAMIGVDAIHDRLLDRPRLPCIVVADLRSEDFSTATESSEEHFLTLEAWSDDQGQRAAQEIAARLRVLLHDADLTLAGATLVNLQHRATRARREPKMRRHVAEMRFRAVTE